MVSRKNPMGYCGIGGTGVSCPIGLGVDTAPAQTEALPPQSAPAV
jgi:hypothetical protein